MLCIFKKHCWNFSGAIINEIEEDSLPEAPAPSRNTSYSSLVSLDVNHPLSGHGLRDVINQHIDTGSDTENSLEMEDEPIDASVTNASQCASSNSEAMEMACSFVRYVLMLILINYQFYNFLQLKKLTIFFQMVLSSDKWQP